MAGRPGELVGGHRGGQWDGRQGGASGPGGDLSGELGPGCLGPSPVQPVGEGIGQGSGRTTDQLGQCARVRVLQLTGGDGGIGADKEADQSLRQTRLREDRGMLLTGDLVQGDLVPETSVIAATRSAMVKEVSPPSS